MILIPLAVQKMLRRLFFRGSKFPKTSPCSGPGGFKNMFKSDAVSFCCSHITRAFGGGESVFGLRKEMMPIINL